MRGKISQDIVYVDNFFNFIKIGKGASLVTQMVKSVSVIWGDTVLITESRRSPGEGNDHPLQCSCLEKSVGRGAWQATVHEIDPWCQSGWGLWKAFGSRKSEWCFVSGPHSCQHLHVHVDEGLPLVHAVSSLSSEQLVEVMARKLTISANSPCVKSPWCSELRHQITNDL